MTGFLPAQESALVKKRNCGYFVRVAVIGCLAFWDRVVGSVDYPLSYSFPA